MQTRSGSSNGRPSRAKTATAASTASLRQLMAQARRKIAAGQPLPEAEVLQLSNRILASLETRRTAGKVTEDVLSAPETLLQLRMLARPGRDRRRQ